MSEKDNIDDFGFTFEDIAEDRTDDLQARLQLMYDTIIPLLNNLCANPEMETIKWPNRAKKIKEFKTKLTNILEGTNV